MFQSWFKICYQLVNWKNKVLKMNLMLFKSCITPYNLNKVTTEAMQDETNYTSWLFKLNLWWQSATPLLETKDAYIYIHK